jgi:hypothetical protein
MRAVENSSDSYENLRITVQFTVTTVNILLFFDIQKNGAESLLESQMNIKYDFFKLSILSRG